MFPAVDGFQIVADEAVNHWGYLYIWIYLALSLFPVFCGSKWRLWLGIPGHLKLLKILLVTMTGKGVVTVVTQYLPFCGTWPYWKPPVLLVGKATVQRVESFTTEESLWISRWPNPSWILGRKESHRGTHFPDSHKTSTGSPWPIHECVMFMVNVDQYTNPIGTYPPWN